MDLAIGGADRDRTGDLLNAIQALSQTELQPHAEEGAKDSTAPRGRPKGCRPQCFASDLTYRTTCSTCSFDSVRPQGGIMDDSPTPAPPRWIASASSASVFFFWNAGADRSRGCGSRLKALKPSPAPVSPWHVWQ